VKEQGKNRLDCCQKGLLLSLLLIGLIFIRANQASALPVDAKGPEMTPGPRMIRAVEALANDYLNAAEALALTPEQIKIIRWEALALKKDIWRKEAVLIGMFDEIALKRRHGLLTREDYQAGNQLTGGIETDEMFRMSKAITAIQSVLNPKQQAAFQSIRRPEIDLSHPEGFNTKIGLLALGPYRRAYGQHRKALDLMEPQAVSLRKALQTARRKVIEIGTQIEISRMEAYDLLKEPIIDIKQVEKAMVRTAGLEAVFFPLLSEHSKKFEAILGTDRIRELKRLGKGRFHTPSAHDTNGYNARHTHRKTDALLDRAHRVGLKPSQIKQLVNIEVSAIKRLGSKQVERKIANLELDALAERNVPSQEIKEMIDTLVRLASDIERIKLEKRASGLKVFKNHQKVTFHTPLTHHR